ncbi:unnamed protein product [Callosobruchus maculatus]|uniref:Uncharacterized protein n=1 Tax=Callosobruchus maculatus TaxID=64391 RepID=A0A653BNE0_CALMS|nr:unnamed protein product [Callosobruchus maculatus]
MNCGDLNSVVRPWSNCLQGTKQQIDVNSRFVVQLTSSPSTWTMDM